MRLLTTVSLALVLLLPVAAVSAADPATPPAVTAAPEAQAQPRSLAEPVGAGEYLKMFAGLALILVLIVGMAWTMRRMGRFTSGAQGALRIIAGLSVGQRERVVLLQVGDEQILVGVSAGGVQRIHKLDSPIEAESGQPDHGMGDSFAVRLAAALRGQGKRS